MTASKVYYTSMRTRPDDSIPAKLARLVKAAGLGGDVDVTDKLVAIKAHFGEYGNVSFLKPASRPARRLRGRGRPPARHQPHERLGAVHQACRGAGCRHARVRADRSQVKAPANDHFPQG